MDDSVRVLTLNVWNLDGDHRPRLAELRRWIAELKPDVACFQEVVVQDGPDSHTVAWEDLGYATHLCPIPAMEGVVTLGGRFGNAIVTRLPVNGEGLRRLPGLDRPENRHVQHVDVTLPGRRRLRVCNTHLNWRPEDGHIRRAQMVELADHAHDGIDADTPIVLCGDMNTTPDSPEIGLLTGRVAGGDDIASFRDVWEEGGDGSGVTWHRLNPNTSSTLPPDRRIDYVLIDGDIFVQHAEVVCDVPRTGTYASDHFGVLATLGFDGPGS